MSLKFSSFLLLFLGAFFTSKFSYAMAGASDVELCICKHESRKISIAEKKQAREQELKKILHKELGADFLQSYFSIKSSINIGKNRVISFDTKATLGNFQKIIKGDCESLFFVLHSSNFFISEKKNKCLSLLQDLDREVDFFLENKSCVETVEEKKKLLFEIIKNLKDRLDKEIAQTALEEIKNRYNQCFSVGLGNLVIKESGSFSRKFIEDSRFLVSLCCKNADFDEDLEMVDNFNLRLKCFEGLDKIVKKLED